MILKKLIVENFRNFKSTAIDLSNKNVVFGMNDVGKTNLLYSIRFLLDRSVRSSGFSESDYYQRDTSEPIKITLMVDLKDRLENADSQNIISKVVGARTSSELDFFYFQVVGKYDQSDAFGIPELCWGNDIDNLDDIPQKGAFSDLDKLFNLVYIDPSIDLEKIFNKNRRRLFDQRKLSEKDVQTSNEISKLTEEMNMKISTMEIMKNFQNELTAEYHQLKKEKISIELQSEMAIKGFFSDIYPYIKKEGEENLYPTSGDGRRKLLAYSLVNHLTKEYDSNRITIYLVEEPENSLHRSMQIALSKQLFNYSVYDYFFLSTHSSELLYEMDDATLIRIYSPDKTDCESYLYKVTEEFSTIKKELNEALSTALFSDRVLLIEGPSEKVLFEKVLSVIKPNYELDGGYILLVDGIKFKPYFVTLKGLNILPIVKTDNDLKSKKNNIIEFDLIGLNRGLNLLNRKNLPSVQIDYSTEDENGKKQYLLSEKVKKVTTKKKEIFKREEDVILYLKSNNIFISRIDLEHDLYEAIPEKMDDFFENDPVGKLQNKKLLNMLKFVETFSKEDCEKIYNHKHFEVLKKLVEI